jgi:uncharacterized protein YPO0396
VAHSSWLIRRPALIPWDYGVAKKPREDDSRVLQARDDSSDSSGKKKSPLAGAWQGLAALGYALALPFTTVPLVALLITYPQSIARATIFWW